MQTWQHVLASMVLAYGTAWLLNKRKAAQLGPNQPPVKQSERFAQLFVLTLIYVAVIYALQGYAPKLKELRGGGARENPFAVAADPSQVMYSSPAPSVPVSVTNEVMMTGLPTF